MNLKYNYPILIFALALTTAIYLSFKHDRAANTLDRLSATEQERLDQINLSAAHAEPAMATNGATAAQAVPSSDPVTPAVQALQASAEDLKKLQTLDEVLASHNDNDPRLDQEFKNLSPTAKTLMKARYASVPTEKRNQRGTIVFLMGRELSTPEDAEFIHAVMSEPPCLSLADCAHEDKGSVQPGDHHQEGMTESTLAYPQLVALRTIQSYLDKQGATGALSPQLLSELEAAKRSPVRRIASMAEDIARALAANNRAKASRAGNPSG